jgi:probable phosphoglycerate mutase
MTAPVQAASTHVKLVFDGGALGNPGKGYGSFVYAGAVKRMRPLTVEYPGITTNNQAEYMTLIRALESVMADLRAAQREPSEISLEIRSDSQLLVEQVNGRWKVRAVELRPLVEQVRSLLNRFGPWKLTWHPRSESVRLLGH